MKKLLKIVLCLFVFLVCSKQVQAAENYIYMGEKGDQAIVMPVLATRRFEVPYTALPTVGKKVTLHTDGLQITSTDTGGVFDVVSVDQASGTATGYFR